MEEISKLFPDVEFETVKTENMCLLGKKKYNSPRDFEGDKTAVDSVDNDIPYPKDGLIRDVAIKPTYNSRMIIQQIIEQLFPTDDTDDEVCNDPDIANID